MPLTNGTILAGIQMNNLFPNFFEGQSTCPPRKNRSAASCRTMLTSSLLGRTRIRTRDDFGPDHPIRPSRGPTRRSDVLASFLQGEILSVGRVRAGNELRIGRKEGTRDGREGHMWAAHQNKSHVISRRARGETSFRISLKPTPPHRAAELTYRSDERSSAVSFNREDWRTEGAVGLRLRPTTCSLP